MSTQPYDVVVAGGSFAGLVLATTVTGKVALIEKGEVGEGQTSACGTTLDLVQKLGLEASIEEVHEWGVMHTSRGAHRFRLPYPFCTFDYRAFCRLLLERFDGDLVKASALGVDQKEAGGWSTDADGVAVPGPVAGACRCQRLARGLARSVDPSFPAHAAITYGLEKPARGFDGEGLHFWFDPRVRGDGYGWSFPAGPVARAGVLSYVAPDGVKASTEAFLAREGMTGNHYHGGFLTAGLRPATAGRRLPGRRRGRALPAADGGGDTAGRLLRPAARRHHRPAAQRRHLAGAGARYVSHPTGTLRPPLPAAPQGPDRASRLARSAGWHLPGGLLARVHVLLDLPQVLGGVGADPARRPRRRPRQTDLSASEVAAEPESADDRVGVPA